ncbi:MAG TPA: hypothetical protein VNZ25_01745 [Candidatus Angelobacter sp.]|jgi:hypothetical protein|nr:hypothetical protein [Candidatus Angelobacter sp.]
MSRNWIIAGAAAVCFVTGVALSHQIEPGVSVQKVTLTEETPALMKGSHNCVIFGFQPPSTSASKSSRFNLSNLLPGFRCARLTACD